MMYSLDSVYGNPSISYELIKKMKNYCLNTMRKRTFDEQLRDFSKIMNAPLILNITYKRTELEVRYVIGSENATVKGLNESKCVSECKQNILHNLRVLCKYSNKEACRLAHNNDIYSDIELYKQIMREPVKYESNDIVLIDLETDQAESFISLNERIQDLMNIAKTPLILKVSYFQTEIEMNYKIGSHSSSVKGPIESTCMQTCKIQLLQTLKVFISNHNDFVYGKIADQESLVHIDSDHKKKIAQYELNNDEGVHVNLPKVSETVVNRMDFSVNAAAASSSDRPSTENDDVEINYKENVSAYDSIILEVNPDVLDQSIRRSRSISSNESLSVRIPKSMDQQNRLTCSNIVQNNTNEVSRATNGSSVVMVTDQCSEDSKFITERADESNTCDTRLESSMTGANIEAPNRTQVSAVSPPKPIGPAVTIFDDLEEHEMFVRKASAVLKTVTEYTVSECADKLLDVLVHADRADRSYVGLITDSIVKMAIRDPTNGHLYAGLCSETIEKGSAKPGLDVVCDAFRDDMKMSCNSALSDLPRTSDPTTTASQAYSVSKKVRVRTLETCRFMGRLFMLDRFKMSHTMKKTVNALLGSGDAHCLECLCDLLHIIGPRYEMVGKVSRRCSAEKVYKALEEYACNRTLPPQTVRRINRIIGERNSKWLPREPSS